MCTIFLLCVLLVFIYIDIVKIIRFKFIKKIKLIGNVNDEIYFQSVYLAALKMAKKRSVYMRLQKPDIFIVEIKKMLRMIKRKMYRSYRNDNWKYGWNKGFLFIGLTDSSYYGNIKIDDVKKYFDKYYIEENGTPRFDFINVHQTPFALAALSLFQQTREIKYEIFCRYVYNKLLSWQDKNGLLPYFANTKSEIDFYFVDQLGMYVPFLVRYAKEFDDNNAYAIAKKNLDYWIDYGLDKSGLPFYNVKNNIGLGINSWGRGCAWFILALIEFIQIDSYYLNIAYQLLKTLEKLELRNNTWAQFMGESFDIDSSATIPILLLKSYLDINVDILEVLKKMTDRGGQIIYCSGETCGMIRFSELFGPSDFIQGITLILLNRINSYNQKA